jgi:hypothetical protein
MSSDCDEILHIELSHQYLGRVRRWKWFVKKWLSYSKKFHYFLCFSMRTLTYRGGGRGVPLDPQVLYYGGILRSSSPICNDSWVSPALSLSFILTFELVLIFRAMFRCVTFVHSSCDVFVHLSCDVLMYFYIFILWCFRTFILWCFRTFILWCFDVLLFILWC